MPYRTMRPLALLVATAVAIILAACDENEDPDGTPRPTAIVSATAAPTAPAATIEPFEGGRDPVEEAFDGVAPPVCTLVDVRADEHAGYDRAVFEFADCLPGYRVEYVDEAVQCGSGEIDEVAGSAWLQVNANPAMAHDDAGMTTVPSLELTPGLNAMLELDSICDFEGYVTWVIGLSEGSDFRVTELTAPFRLVVDVQTP